MLYTEQMRQIAEKMGVAAEDIKDGLYSTMLQKIYEKCGSSSGGVADLIVKQGGDTLTWDGNTEGLEVDRDGLIYKVSNAVLSESDCTNCVIYDAGGNECEVVNRQFIDGASEILALVSGVEFFLVSVPTGNFDLYEDGSIIIPSPGIWSIPVAFSLTIPGYTGFAKEVINEKYLPGAVVLYFDESLLLYNSADVTDSANRTTKAELEELVYSGRRIIATINGNQLFFANAVNLGNVYGLVSVLVDEGDGASALYNLCTAEYTP